MGDYGSDWARIRKQHLEHNPTCVLCGDVATVVHHRLTVKDAPLLRLDSENLTSLCKP